MKRSAAAPIPALLKSPEPSIRWKTRVHVLGEDPDARSIRSLREEIRSSSTVRALLSRRDQLGRPGTKRQVYYKWQGLHWVLASLADLGYPEGDETLHPLRDRVLELWLGPGYFHEFIARTAAEAYRGRGVPLMRGRYRRCGSQQGNALMETLLPMLGRAVYARKYRRPSAAKAARAAEDVFLRRRLFKRVSDGRVITPNFVALHYPRYWHYDFLGGLKAMMQLGRIRDARCTDALDLLEERRLPDGGWPAEKRYYKVSRKTMTANADYVDWGGTSTKRMNEWVTVDALAVLRAAGRLDP
jgi:hypothetical protein